MGPLGAGEGDRSLGRMLGLTSRGAGVDLDARSGVVVTAREQHPFGHAAAHEAGQLPSTRPRPFAELGGYAGPVAGVQPAQER